MPNHNVPSNILLFLLKYGNVSVNDERFYPPTRHPFPTAPDKTIFNTLKIPLWSIQKLYAPFSPGYFSLFGGSFQRLTNQQNSCSAQICPDHPALTPPCCITSLYDWYIWHSWLQYVAYRCNRTSWLRWWIYAWPIGPIKGFFFFF